MKPRANGSPVRVKGKITKRNGQPYKPSVVRGYQQALRDRVLPELGGALLSEIRHLDIQEFVDRLRAAGLDASTVRNTIAPVRVIYRRAVSRGEVAVNPTSGLELPTVEGLRDRIVSPGEAAELLAALRSEDQALWATALFAGLRAGELAALRWEDVDLVKGVMRVDRSYDFKSRAAEEELALHLERHDVEEDGHQEVVDDVAEVFLEGERAHFQGHTGRPKALVRVACEVRPEERDDRGAEQERGAACLELQEPLEWANDEARHRPVRTKPWLAKRLPAGITACLFDLDGVLTQTAKVHAAAWKELFDAFLLERSRRTGEPFRPFGLPADYLEHVDGKLRTDGVRAFLGSRGIVLPEGSPGDPPTAETVYGLGSRKNALVLELIRSRGVEVYEGSVRFVEAARDAGLRRAVVSASKNCREVLAAAGIEDLFEVRIDGIVAEERRLRGKPAPDTFLAAAEALAVEPAGCAVFEDAVAGVEAGRAGSFGWVVGVDRTGKAAALARHGADTVVADLAELLGER